MVLDLETTGGSAGHDSSPSRGREGAGRRADRGARHLVDRARTCRRARRPHRDHHGARAGAPPLPAVLPSLLEFLTGSVLVAHNSPFDAGSCVPRAPVTGGLAPPAGPLHRPAGPRRPHHGRGTERPARRAGPTLRHRHPAHPPGAGRRPRDRRGAAPLLERRQPRGAEPRGAARPGPRPGGAAAHPGPNARSGGWPSACRPRPGSTSSAAPATRSSTSAPAATCGAGCAATSPPVSAGGASRHGSLAERVDAVVCAHSLEAAVRELRLITAHKPRYNRRSRHPTGLVGGAHQGGVPPAVGRHHRRGTAPGAVRSHRGGGRGPSTRSRRGAVAAVHHRIAASGARAARACSRAGPVRRAVCRAGRAGRVRPGRRHACRGWWTANDDTRAARPHRRGGGAGRPGALRGGRPPPGRAGRAHPRRWERAQRLAALACAAGAGGAPARTARGGWEVAVPALRPARRGRRRPPRGGLRCR